MSSSSNSSESDSENSSFGEEVGELGDFAPYDDSLEPIATEEEAAAYSARSEQEAEQEQQFQRRFTQQVEESEWCSCSNCSVDFVTKAEECLCCQEIDRCREVMEQSLGDPTTCITLHPGFENVCLNRHVLEVASIAPKTRAGKSYRTMFVQGNRNEAQFLRSVAYRQFTRLLWEYVGSSRRYPLPCCAYHRIRKHFPSQDGQYHGFEDEENS